MSTGTFQRFSLSPNSIICWLALSREHKITSRREKVSEKLESYPGGFEHAHHHAELSQSATHKLVANRNYFSRTLSSRLDFMSCADFFFISFESINRSLQSSAHPKAPRASKFTCLCFLYFGWFSIPSRFGISCYCAWATFPPTPTVVFTASSLITPMISSGKLYASSLFFELFIISFCCFFSIARNKIDGRVICVLRLSTHPALILFCLFSYLVSLFFFGNARIIWCNICSEKVVKVLRKARWLSPVSLIRRLLIHLELISPSSLTHCFKLFRFVSFPHHL